MSGKKQREERKKWEYVFETIFFFVADHIIYLIFFIFFTNAVLDKFGLDVDNLPTAPGPVTVWSRFKFGAGCFQYTFVFVKFIFFDLQELFLNRFYREKQDRLLIALLLHVVVFIYNIHLVTHSGYGWSAIEMFRQIGYALF